jgi:hypothetical protein
MAQRLAQDLEIGQASRFYPSRDGGYILYMKDRTPVDDAKLKEELPEFTDRLRQYRFSQAFEEWFRKAAEQASLSGPKPVPEMAPGPQPSPSPATPGSGG